MKRMRIATTLLLLALLAPAAAITAQGSPARPDTPAAEPGGLLFIENAGQFDPAARFQVWGGTGTVWLAEDAIWLTVVEPGDRDQGSGDRSQASGVRGQEMGRFSDAPDDPSAVRGSAPQRAVNLKLSFPGANPQPVIEPFDRLDTHVSYFIGNDPAKWRADVPVWGGMRYRDLYPGVDLVVAGAGAGPAPADGRPQGSPLRWRLEGADLTAVRLRVEGADAVAVDGGALRLTTAAGNFTLPLLVAERQNPQRANAQRTPGGAFDVAAPFVPTSSNWRSALLDAVRAVARPDFPADNPADLLYGTFLGGSGEDYVYGISAVNHAFLTGSTNSSDFPTTVGAVDTSYNGSGDAYVVKLNPTGSYPTLATFIGGSGGDVGSAIAVDDFGSAYLVGYTSSSNFPTTSGAFDTSYNGGTCDAFVVKLSPPGTPWPTPPTWAVKQPTMARVSLWTRRAAPT